MLWGKHRSSRPGCWTSTSEAQGKYKERFLYLQSVERGKGVSREPCQPLAVCDYINKLVLAHIPLYIAPGLGVVLMCKELCSLRLGLQAFATCDTLVNSRSLYCTVSSHPGVPRVWKI